MCIRDSVTTSGISEDTIPYALATDKKTGNSIYLTDEEVDMILNFRTLSNENKQIITGFLHSNSKHPD